MKNLYEVLGVSKNATPDEIKKAYRKMAKKYHPDLHPGDAAAEAMFKEVNESYEVLSDPDKKARYDQYGFAGVDPNFGAGAGGYGGYGYSNYYNYAMMAQMMASMNTTTSNKEYVTELDKDRFYNGILNGPTASGAKPVFKVTFSAPKSAE